MVVGGLVVTQPHSHATVAVYNAIAAVGVGIEVGVGGATGDGRPGMGGNCGVVAWFGVVVGGAGTHGHTAVPWLLFPTPPPPLVLLLWVTAGDTR